MNCKYCGESKSLSRGRIEFASGDAHKNHEYRCPSNPNRITQNGNRGKSSWSKGLTKESDPRIEAQAAQTRGRVHPNHHSAEGLEKLSRLAKERGLGGYRPHPNKGERYKGLFFDSKWEVRVAKSLDENEIRWEQPKVGFVWNDHGNKYYPDFFLPDFDVFLDPKNSFLRVKDKEKIENAQLRNGIRVFVLTEDQLTWKEIHAAIFQ